MNSKEKKNVDTRVNEIIIRTTAILVSVFATIGLVMSQVFSNGRFYELLSWSMTLAIPFIISAIVSVLVVGYGPELPLFRFFRHASIWLYIVAWFWFIIQVAKWSPEWFWKMMNSYILFIFLLGILSASIYCCISAFRKWMGKH